MKVGYPDAHEAFNQVSRDIRREERRNMGWGIPSSRSEEYCSSSAWGGWREGLSYHNVSCLVSTFAAVTQMTQTDTDQIREELLMS